MEDKFAPLRLAARPGSSLDEFNVYYQAFKNHMGIVKVKLSSDDLRLPTNHHKAIAEVKALEYLLAGIEVLSHGRKGDTVQITATSKAIKEIMLINQLSRQMRGKLLNEARDLKYIKGTNLPLACYSAMCSSMPSVIARFLPAKIIISDDIKWINPVVPEKNIHYHISSQAVMHRVEVNGSTIAITVHAFYRFRERVSFNTPEGIWNCFLAYFRQATFKLPLSKKDQDEYDSDGVVFKTHFYDPKSFWHFIVAQTNGELFLLTCYEKEININDYIKR